jgi:cytochrome c biogenesis protein
MKSLLKRTFILVSSLNCTIILLVMFSLTILADTMEDAILSFSQDMSLAGEGAVSNLLNGYFSTDVHASWWFKLLLILFILNLLACMVKRIPGTLRALSLNGAAAARSIPPAPSYQDTFTMTGLRQGFYQDIYSLLAEQWSRPVMHHSATRAVFFCQRGRLFHGGFYLAHGGLLLVLAGGFVGSSSLSGEMYLREGESDDRIFVTENGIPCFTKLDYAIRLNRLEPIESTVGGTNPTHPIYRSTVTVLRKGEKDVKGVLEGYGTFTTNGIRIGQARSPEQDNRQIQLAIRSRKAGGMRRTCSLRRFQCCSIPETGHTVRLKGVFCSHHSTGVALRKTASASLPSCMAVLEVYGNNHSLLYKPYVASHAASTLQPWDKEYEFLITGVDDGESSSGSMRLIIRTEPGGKLIWAGVGVAVTGFSLLLLLSHRKLWVTVEKGSGECRITVAGWSSRTPDVLKQYAGRIKDLALKWQSA